MGPSAVGWPLFYCPMKDTYRVRLSLVLWAIIAVAFICCGVIAYQRLEEEAAEAPATTSDSLAVVAPESMDVSATQLNYIPMLVEGDNAPFNALQSLAVVVVRNDSVVYRYTFGSPVESLPMPIMADVAALQSVEKGSISLDMLQPATVGNTVLDDASRFMIMLLSKGEVKGRRMLSPCSVEMLLTPRFGWGATPYASLLGESAIEYSTASSALVVDTSRGVGIVVVANFDDAAATEEFASLRSHIASIVAASLK